MDPVIFFLATYLIYLAPLCALYVIIASKSKNPYKEIALVAVSSFVAWVICVLVLKNLFAHARPSIDQALFIPNDLYSFPSGHAAFMYALFFAMYYFVGRGWIVPLVLAVLTSVARVLAHVHYWYDIIGSIFFSGIIVYLLARWYTTHSKRVKVS